ncbi:MAG: ROK family transcriptional regulator [Rhizobiaceae bacterium]|nr:ROK family transcriptional regulator [Rhizobiaceae bacterium]
MDRAEETERRARTAEGETGGVGDRQVPDERMRGSNQSGLRAHNERAVLSLIRRHGVMAKADIARRTGLSPQTASVIMRALELEELVLRDEPRRGKVGQPSIPMRLNPDGAFSLGLKIGRRSVDLVLMDFVGTIRAHVRRTYRLPRLAEIRAFVREASDEVTATLDAKRRGRIVGLGVAMPYELWDWAEEIGAPPGVMDEWRDLDVEAEIGAAAGYPVYLANDATAACASEHVFGTIGSLDYLYFFVGAFIGGGIVMDGDLVSGRLGNAGALGSMPVPRPGGQGGFDQLLNSASLHVLEKMMRDAGRDPLDLWRTDGGASWAELGPLLDDWVRIAARSLAHAIVSAISVYDFECAVIDGSFPPQVRQALVEATRLELAGLRLVGLSPVDIRAGTIGAAAREIGSASLPFFARFLLDHRVLYTEKG